MVRPESRVVLADERSVRVSAGAPGSRLQAGGEIRSGDGETTSGRGTPNGSSIGWTAMFTAGLLNGWAGGEGREFSGWRSGPMTVLSIWVCTD